MHGPVVVKLEIVLYVFLSGILTYEVASGDQGKLVMLILLGLLCVLYDVVAAFKRFMISCSNANNNNSVSDSVSLAVWMAFGPLVTLFIFMGVYRSWDLMLYLLGVVGLVANLPSHLFGQYEKFLAERNISTSYLFSVKSVWEVVVSHGKFLLAILLIIVWHYICLNIGYAFREKCGVYPFETGLLSPDVFWNAVLGLDIPMASPIHLIRRLLLWLMVMAIVVTVGSSIFGYRHLKSKGSESNK